MLHDALTDGAEENSLAANQNVFTFVQRQNENVPGVDEVLFGDERERARVQTDRNDGR